MPIDSVGYVDYFNAPSTKKGVRQVTQEQETAFQQSSVFSYPYPENPGLIAPQKDTNSAVKAATVTLGTLAALAVAIAFRGKIKGGITSAINAVKPYIPKGIKNIVKSGLGYAQSAYKTVKTYVPTGVKTFIKNAYKTVSKYIDKATGFVKNILGHH